MSLVKYTENLYSFLAPLIKEVRSLMFPVLV